MTELSLSVKRSKFRKDDPERDHSDKEFKALRKSILTDNHYTCDFCGFQSKKFQEVHHVDDNHQNNDRSNLVVACPLCHSCHHIGFSGHTERGVLIFLDPDLGIKQTNLNQLIRQLWILEEVGNKTQKLGAISYRSRLYKQTVSARRKIGTSDPSVISEMLLSMDDTAYGNRSKILEGIYYLPLKEGYKNQLKYWCEASQKVIPNDRWLNISVKQASKWHSCKNKTELADKLGITI